jgi:hypothetical protein
MDIIYFYHQNTFLLVQYEVEMEEIQCAVTRELNNISKTAFLEDMKLKKVSHF